MCFFHLQILGMVVEIPFAILAFPAALMGIVLAVFDWKEWPLVVMAGGLVGVVLLRGVSDGLLVFRASVVLYSVLAVALCVRFFVASRHNDV